MTELLSRPARTTRHDEPAQLRSLPAQGASAALWSALAGLLLVGLPVLLVWALDDRSGTGAVEVLRSAGRFWLVAHGAALDVPGGSVSLTPLGLLALPLALLVRFATAAAREAGRVRARRLAAWTALPYAGLVLLVALVVSGPQVHVSPVASVGGALLLGATAGAVGAVRGGARPRPPSSPLLLGTGAALALLLGAGALLTGGALALHLDAAVELAGAGDPGPVGGAALLLGGLALLPNAVLWAVSWLAGPGFAVGVGTAVGPFDHALGDVPALPLLAALPAGPVPTAVGVLVLAVPLLCGTVGGAVLQRARAALPGPVAGPLRAALQAAVVGPATGAVVGVLTVLSAGSLGGERLAEVGPRALPVGLAVSALVGAGAAAGGALAARRRAPQD